MLKDLPNFTFSKWLSQDCLQETMIFTIVHSASLCPQPVKFNSRCFPLLSLIPSDHTLFWFYPPKFMTMFQYISECVHCTYQAFEQMMNREKIYLHIELRFFFSFNRALGLNCNGLWFKQKTNLDWLPNWGLDTWKKMFQLEMFSTRKWHVISYGNTHLLHLFIFFLIGLIKQITGRILDSYVFHNEESHGLFKQKLKK